MASKYGVPVWVYGRRVGSAIVNDDGTVDFIMEPSKVGQDLLDGLLRGIFDGINIAPSLAPMPEPEKTQPDVFGEIAVSQTERDIIGSVPTNVVLVPPYRNERWS